MGLLGKAEQVEGPGCVTRKVREGTVRLPVGEAGETKNLSARVMKPPAMGDIVT